MAHIKLIVYIFVCIITMRTVVAQKTCASLESPLMCVCEDLNNETTVRCKSNQTDIFDFNSGFIQHTTHLYIVGDTSLFTFDQIICIFNCSNSGLKTLDVEGNRRDIEISDKHMAHFTVLECLRFHNCYIKKISEGAFKT